MAKKADINHRHIVLLHESRDELLGYLVNYYSEAIEEGKLCVYVTSHSQDEVIDDFKRHGLNIKIAVDSGRFKIFDMQETYLPNGEFVVDYMLSNVEQFINDAASDGFNGIYTAGEMQWLYDRPELWYKAAHYEGAINDLQDRYENFTGLCLYPTANSQFIEELAMHTHSFKMDNGLILPNEQYVAA